MSHAADPMPDGWLNGRQSCLILDCSLSALFRAAMLGYVRFERDPGCPPRFLRADVEQYARMKPGRVPRARRKKKPPTGEVLTGSRLTAETTQGHS